MSDGMADRLLACRYVSSLSCATKAGVDPDNQPGSPKTTMFRPEDRHKRITTASSLELTPAENSCKAGVTHRRDMSSRQTIYSPRCSLPQTFGQALPVHVYHEDVGVYNLRIMYGAQNADMPYDPQQGSFQPLPQSHSTSVSHQLEERVGGFAFRTHMTCRICKFGDVICRRSSQKAIPSCPLNEQEGRLKPQHVRLSRRASHLHLDEKSHVTKPW